MVPSPGEFRSAARELVRHPLLAALVTVSAGLGIGANAIVFSWLESTVLHPYPMVGSPERLVALNMRAPDEREWPLSYPVYRDWRESRVFDGVAAWSAARLTRRRGAGDGAGETWAMLVSANYFDVLRVRPARGRGFTADDEKRGNPVAVITHAYWQREFGSDLDIVGRTLDLNGVEVQIVGVAPRGFVGTYVGAGFDVFVPLTLQPQLLGASTLEVRGARWLQSFARLKPGTERASVAQQFDAAAHGISKEAGDAPLTGAFVQRMRDQFLGSLVYPLFMAMLAVTALVLLVACANVANLLLARALARRNDTALRMALGASPGRAVAPLLSESLLLAAPGFAVAVVLAYSGKGLIHRFVPPVAMRVELPIVMNARVIAFALIATALSVLISAIWPAIRAARAHPMQAMRDASGATPRSRMRDALVVGQLALSMTSVVCAGLFVRSLDAARSIDLGFDDPDTILLAGTDMTLVEQDSLAAGVRVEQLLEKIRAIPGVRAAAIATMVPLGFGGHRYADVQAEGHVPSPEENLSAERVVVSAGYFETMGSEIVQGRAFRDDDRAGGAAVAVVNEAFVRRFWPGRDPVGRSVSQGQAAARVIGVVRDGKYRNLDDTDYPVVYWPLAQTYEPRFTVHVRALAEPRWLWDALRLAFANESADLPLLAPRTLAEHIRAATMVQQIGGSMLGLFGALALVMAAVGILGSMLLNVTARRRELGVRLALGAQRSQVALLVLTKSLRLALYGCALGLPAAAAAGFLLRAQLVGVAPLDPRAFSLALLLIFTVAIITGVVSAARAAFLDPARILKSR
jgi:predicted permease